MAFELVVEIELVGWFLLSGSEVLSVFGFVLGINFLKFLVI
jgi:hypothetical protein